jgi:TonB family protein
MMMKTLSIISFACAVTVGVHAQQSTPVKASSADQDIAIDAPMPHDTSADKNKIFSAVEQIPQFPGGTQAFYRFLMTNIRYPATAFEKHIQGKVFLTFVIEKDGGLTDIKVIRSVSPDIDAEALRVMNMSPKWVPGIQNGKPVRVMYTIPISFTLQKN